MTTATDAVPTALALATALRPAGGGFPYFAEALRQAGITRHMYTVPAATSVYELGTGAVVDRGVPLVTGVVEVAPFDVDALMAGLRTDQSGRGSYAQFVAASWAAGVLWYQVDFEARTCTYHGVSGARHDEAYPAVEL